MSITTPFPGLHHGVPFEEYQQWDAINFSRLKPMRSSAAKCRWEMDHPKEPTKAMVLGSALHVATLEPARFEGLFHICPPADGRTAEGKALLESERQKAGRKLFIRQGSKEDESVLGEVEIVRGMANAVRNHRVATWFISGTAQNEVSMLWKDEATGLMCKARMDRCIPEFEKLGGIPVIVELKSCRNAQPWAFAKDCSDRGYAIQSASCCEGYYRITGKRPAHVFIAVENFAPFDLKVHMLQDASLQTGILQYRQMLDCYAECVKSGKWPGYSEEINKLELPAYALEGSE